MENKEQKTAKTEQVTVKKNLVHKRKDVAPGAKITVRFDQAERLAKAGVVERSKP